MALKTGSVRRARTVEDQPDKVSASSGQRIGTDPNPRTLMTIAQAGRLNVRMGSRHRVSMPSLALTYPAILSVCALVIFLLTRIVLTVASAKNIEVGLLPYVFAQGLWFDVVTLGTLLAPFWLANALIPDWVRCSWPFAWSSRASSGYS